MKTFIYIILSITILSGCMDVIDLKVPKGEELLAVEGSITTEDHPYIVKLTLTQPYFSESNNPMVTGAILTISDSEGNQEVLTEEEPGIYKINTMRGKVGNTYKLNIKYNEEEYEATTAIRRVSVIDSLVFEFQKENKPLERKAGYIFKYNGPEPEGVGDYYRFKTYRNDTLFNDPSDLVVTNDQLVDGNYIGNVDFSDDYIFQINDKIKVEGVSLTEDAYHFFTELFTQINNAQAGIFANPITNVRTNINNLNPNSKKKAVGYFYGAGIFSKEGVLTEPNQVIR